jgi:hypothetical protein
VSRSKVPQPGSRRMPSDSTFYDRIVPIILLLLSALFVLMLLAAVAAVMGWVRL